MPIRVNSFMGKFGWFARKHFPMLASNAYLKMQFVTRSKSQKAYCDYFLNAKEVVAVSLLGLTSCDKLHLKIRITCKHGEVFPCKPSKLSHETVNSYWHY